MNGNSLKRLGKFFCHTGIISEPTVGWCLIFELSLVDQFGSLKGNEQALPNRRYGKIEADLFVLGPEHGPAVHPNYLNRLKKFSRLAAGRCSVEGCGRPSR